MSNDISTESVIPVDAARLQVQRAPEPEQPVRMKELPNISKLVSEFTLADASDQEKKAHARELARVSLGLIALLEGDWQAVKVAHKLAEARVVK